MPGKGYTDEDLANMSSEEFAKYMSETDAEVAEEKPKKAKKKKRGYLGILSKRHQQIQEAMGD